MFCKSEILIFIFAENNYLVRQYICPHHVIKTPLLYQSFGPCVFLSFFLYLYFWLISWSIEAGCVTQGILASLLLSLSPRRLWTTRFRFNKGPTENTFCKFASHTQNCVTCGGGSQLHLLWQLFHNVTNIELLLCCTSETNMSIIF